MTIFAGAYSLSGAPIPERLRHALATHVSRRPGHAVRVFDHPGFYAVHVDVGAFSCPALAESDGDVTLAVGEPLHQRADFEQEWSRQQDAAELLGAARAGTLEQELTCCSGTFAGFAYQVQSHRLQLFVDRIGVRPLYAWISPEWVVFATALRILEQLSDVPKALDLRGVSEIAAFNYPLADRTPYQNIHAFRPAELVACGGGQVARAQYWRWDQPTVGDGGPEAMARSYAAFMQAIARRVRHEPVAAAFLSGGLDSRAIVGGLRALGREVYTLNLAPNGAQDQVFGDLVARALGTHHTQIETDADNALQGYRKMAVATWMQQQLSALPEAQRPRRMWSGDGGSVALGHVYLTRPVVAALKQGDLVGALHHFGSTLPARILQASLRAELAQLPVTGALEELSLIRSPDAGRTFHLFLMFNDQRRHLAQHFDDIDRHAIEFQLPFFDADFLATILSQASEPFYFHQFYVKWLSHFPNGLDQVPWQAYPGHVPCPLPMPANLKYQWETYHDSAIMRESRRRMGRHGRAILSAPSFPSHLLDRSVLRMAVWLTRLGWRDCSYLIKGAMVFQKYWAMSQPPAAVGVP